MILKKVIRVYIVILSGSEDMKSGHIKKMIAPILITIILLVIEILYLAVVMKLIPQPFGYLISLIPLFLIIIVIRNIIERINEIRSGYEDDLSKY